MQHFVSSDKNININTLRCFTQNKSHESKLMGLIFILNMLFVIYILINVLIDFCINFFAERILLSCLCFFRLFMKFFIIFLHHLFMSVSLQSSCCQFTDNIIDNPNNGTAITIPTSPHRPPNNRMENNTQKLETPVVLPRIFGPMIFPSTC